MDPHLDTVCPPVLCLVIHILLDKLERNLLENCLTISIGTKPSANFAKMSLVSPGSGVVKEIYVSAGKEVDAEQTIAAIEHG